MSELTRKAIEAGIIPKQAIQLMKMWQALPDDMPEEAKKERTERQLLDQVKELEELLEEDQELPEMRETDLNLGKEYETKRTVTVQVRLASQTLRMAVLSDRTRQGKFIFSASDLKQEHMTLVSRRGNIIEYDGQDFMITTVEPMYTGENLSFYLCTVEKKNAELSNMQKPG